MNGERKVRNEWLERGGDVLVMSFAVAAATLLLWGCGREKKSEPVAQANRPAAVENVMPAVATTSAAPVQNAALSQGSTANGLDGVLPPEIALGEIDTLVTPGQPVHVTVYGTPDVTEISMFDGLNDRQALVHDTEHDTWSVDYRVPLRSKSDRVGLSLTAKNAANRWRRVWVFLKVGSPATASTAAQVQPAATPDSIVTR